MYHLYPQPVKQSFPEGYLPPAGSFHLQTAPSIQEECKAAGYFPEKDLAFLCCSAPEASQSSLSITVEKQDSVSGRNSHLHCRRSRSFLRCRSPETAFPSVLPPASFCGNY